MKTKQEFNQQRLRSSRELANMSVEQLAVRLELSARQVSERERGTSKVTALELGAWADCVDQRVAHFYTEDTT